MAGTLPPAERTDVVVFTGDYGAAGAIDLYGRTRYGLPHAISGHNTYWLWGPAGARNGATTIAIDLSKSYLTSIFAQVTPAGTVDTPHGVWTEERGDPIWICHRQKLTWAKAWPDAQHYGLRGLVTRQRFAVPIARIAVVVGHHRIRVTATRERSGTLRAPPMLRSCSAECECRAFSVLTPDG